MKKGIIVISLLALLGGLYWLFGYQTLFRTPLSEIKPLEAVPPQTSFILEFDNYFQTRNVLAKMPYTKAFENAFFVKKLSEDFQPIRKLFAKTKAHRRLLLYSPLMAALQISEANDADFLYIIKDENNHFQLKEVLKQYNYKKFDSNGNTVYELHADGVPSITIGYYRGLILLSKYAALVENGMSQVKAYPSPLITEENYAVFSKKIKSNANKKKSSSVNVYLLLENLPAFAHPFMNESLQNRLKGMAQLIASAKLGFDFQKDGVAVNGHFQPTQLAYEQFFQKEKENKSEIYNILPDDIAYTLRADVQLIQKNEIYQKYFQPWVAQEWSIGCAKIYTRRMQSEQFMVYQMQDLKKAKFHLRKFSEDYGELTSSNYMMYPIHQVMTEDLPLPFLTGENTYIKNPFYTFIENYVVFAASEPTLKNWIDKYITSQTLSNHLSFLELENRMEDEGNWSVFWNTSGTLPLMKSFFKQPISGEFQNQIERFVKMQPIGFQMYMGEDDVSTTGFFNYQEYVEQDVANLWKTKLEDRIITQPSVHYDSRSKDHQVLIQDETFQLYALNSSGEVLWKVMLEDSIRSPIVAMDIFKKRKNYYVFNTKKNIVALDSKGRMARGFPMALPDDATNGMSIVDFGEKDYAFFVACQNGNVYGYNTKRKPIVGWNPVEQAGRITMPLQHFQYKRKDYLTWVNDDGDLMSFRKNGKKVMQGSNVSGASSSALFFHPENTNQMVVADETGSIHAIHVDGKNIQLNLKADISNTFQFVATDLAGDDQLDIAKLNGRNLEILYAIGDDFHSKAVFQFPNIQHQIFEVGADENNKAMIGTVNPYQARIYLLDKNANVHPAFPLVGTTPFQLVRGFNHDKNVVVVGNGNEVVVYEL